MLTHLNIEANLYAYLSNFIYIKEKVNASPYMLDLSHMVKFF